MEKAEYLVRITNLTEKVNDLSLLDLIIKILEKSVC